MSSEREKLIEIWLDNAGERQYQFGFRNSLLTGGYTILHDTSHTALELGKDVLAFSPDRKLLAYQLKGNPGGRLTISQWQQLIPQINTLVYQPVSHPAVKPGTAHTPVLVTNGEIHEDVLAAIAAYNANVHASVPKARGLETIARGQLLRMFIDSADTLWPAGVQTQRKILNVFSSSGDDELPIEDFVGILTDIMHGKYSDTALPAAHLISAIVASNWIAYSNYFELVKMYALLAVASACYQSRWKKQRMKDTRFLDLIVSDLQSNLRYFLQEMINDHVRSPLINTNVFGEFGYYHERKKIISGLLSAALLDAELPLTLEERSVVRDLVCNWKHSRFLIWEGIIPSCLAEIWALSNIQGTRDPDHRLASLINAILNSNDQEDTQNHLPGPYYRLADAVEWKNKQFLQNLRSTIDQDNNYRRSWFAEPLFMLLVRRNYKNTCKYLWPLLTKFVHTRTRLPDGASFGPALCDKAFNEDKLIDVTTQKTWVDLTKQVGEDVTPLIPKQLLRRPILVLIYSLFLPYRMDRDVILWLDRQFCKSSWY